MTVLPMRTEGMTIDGPGKGAPPEHSHRTANLLDLQQTLAMLRRHARLIGATCLCVIMLAIGFLLVVSPVYTATTVVLVDPRTERVVRSEEVLSGIGSDAAAVESQVEVIESTSLAKPIIEKFDLYNDPEFAGGGTMRRIASLIFPGSAAPRADISDPVLQDRVYSRFRKNLNVNRRGLTYVLEIGFDSTNPKKAADIANALALAYLTDQKDTKFNATAGASKWLNERISALRMKVRESAKAVAEFKAKNNIVDINAAVPGSGDTLGRRKIAELNQQLILARARRAEAQAQI